MARKNEDGVIVAGSDTDDEALERMLVAELKKGPHSMGALTKRFQAKAKSAQIRKVLDGMIKAGVVLSKNQRAGAVVWCGRPATIFTLAG